MSMLEYGTDLAITNHKNCFHGVAWKELLKINWGMRFASSCSKFEYVHIVLTSNTEMREHLDFKNNYPVGYEICIVCSSFITIATIEYCLSWPHAQLSVWHYTKHRLVSFNYILF